MNTDRHALTNSIIEMLAGASISEIRTAYIVLSQIVKKV